MADVTQYRFFEALRQLKFIDEIILYGSRARGDNQERSDIDLAIKCPDASDADWQIILQIIENADTLLKIDCVRFDTLDVTNELHQAILREGVVLYAKKEN